MPSAAPLRPPRCTGCYCALVQAGHGPDPRRYFRWGFDRDSFWLQQRTDQRMDPNTNGLYPHKLLTVMAYSDTNSLPQTN